MNAEGSSDVAQYNNRNRNDTITAEKKRKRGSRACDLCRRKKVKCHFKPGEPCLNCIAYEEMCVFSKELKRRGPMKGYSSFMESRFRKLEAGIQKVDQKRKQQKNLSQQRLQQRQETSDDSHAPSSPLPTFIEKNKESALMSQTTTERLRQEQIFISASSKYVQKLDSLHVRQWPPGISYDSVYYLGDMAELQFLSGKLKLNESSKWKGHSIKRFGDRIVLVADTVNEVNISGNKIPHFQWKDVSPGGLGIHGYVYSVTGVDQHTAIRLLKIYFSNVHPILPVINKIEFLKQYRDKSETYPSGELLNAMFGAAARFVECEHLEPHRLKSLPRDSIWDVPVGWSDRFFNQAQDIVSKWTANPTASKVQAIVLIHNHRGNLDSKSSACWLMGGFAIRLAQMLGLHRNCDDWAISDSEKEMRKRLWWALYVSDRFQSALQGKPLSIQDEDADVGYPDVSTTWKEVLDEPDSDEEGIIAPRFPSATCRPHDTSGQVEIYQLFIQFVKLSEILGRIIKGLYSPKAVFNGSEHGIDILVTSLDHELTEWRFSFSKALRQSRHEDFDEDTGYFTPVTASMLLFYFSALILLHRPFIQFSTTGTPVSKSSFSSFQICTSSATRGIRIAASLSVHDFLLCPYSFSLYPVMQCCLIHIYNTRNIDKQIAQAAKMDLKKGMDLLDQLQNMSSSAKKLNDLLRNIIDKQHKVPTDYNPDLNNSSKSSNMNDGKEADPSLEVISISGVSPSIKASQNAQLVDQLSSRSHSIPQSSSTSSSSTAPFMFRTLWSTPSVSSLLDTTTIKDWQTHPPASELASREYQQHVPCQEAYTLQQFGFSTTTHGKTDRPDGSITTNISSSLSPLNLSSSYNDTQPRPSSAEGATMSISSSSSSSLASLENILDKNLFKSDRNNPFWGIPASMNWDEWDGWFKSMNSDTNISPPLGL